MAKCSYLDQNRRGLGETEPRKRTALRPGGAGARQRPGGGGLGQREAGSRRGWRGGAPVPDCLLTLGGGEEGFVASRGSSLGWEKAKQEVLAGPGPNLIN
jgi:hypothetical protein